MSNMDMILDQEGISKQKDQGNGHSSAPQPEDSIKEQLKQVAAAWTDYLHYALATELMWESFDESFEEFNWNAWFKYHVLRDPDIVCEEIEADCLFCQLAEQLTALEKRASTACINILKKALHLPPAQQHELLGFVCPIPDLSSFDWERLEEELSLALAVSEYHSEVDKNFAHFIALFKNIMDEWQTER